MESSSSPDGPEAIEAKRAAAAAKLTAASLAMVTAESDTPELRKFCLELAARGQANSPALIIATAKEFRDFVLKG